MPHAPQIMKESRKLERAFSLLEVLAVTALAMLFMALAGNIMRVDPGRADVNAAIDKFSGILHESRWEARSKATFVWVCLRAKSPGGDEGMEVALFSSRDGTYNSDPTNLSSISQRYLLRRVALGGASQGTPGRLLADYASSSIDPAQANRLGGATPAIGGGGQGLYTDSIVCFNPRGEAFVPGQAAAGFIEILFSPLKSGTISELQSSAILLSRATGAAQIYR